jgi:Na+/H+-dicarboxylate symporter
LKIICYLKAGPLIAFRATSGEAMIVKLERMGCSEETVGLVLPTGFSFNTDGTAIYMTMAVLFIAQATDIQLTIGQQLTMLFVMLFTSKGAAGVAGAGFVALAATLPALGRRPRSAPRGRAFHVRDPRRHQSLQQYLRDRCSRAMDGRTR